MATIARYKVTYVKELVFDDEDVTESPDGEAFKEWARNLTDDQVLRLIQSLDKPEPVKIERLVPLTEEEADHIMNKYGL
jgi:hypothetical protein